MRVDKKSVLIAIIPFIISTVLTLYTVSAHMVASFIYEGEGGILYWTVLGGGWFLPWPGRRGPEFHILMPIESKVTMFIYRYLIKTWVLVVVSILMWAVTGLFMYKARKPLIRSIMGLSKRPVLKVFVLCIISTVFTLYTVSAHMVASFIYIGEGGAYWTSSPSGSLFPWPRKPGMMMVFSEINEIDLFIYRYLIKTRVLVVLSILMWAVTGFFMYKARKSIISRLRALPW